jgi:hypothetical protein
MLQRLDKFAPWIALGLLGYLTYSAISEGLPKAAEGKDPPRISKGQLTVKLTPATAHASPVDRDPFEVAWSSYLTRTAIGQPTSVPSRQPTVPTTSLPATPELPPLPQALGAVYIGEDLRLVVIDEVLYKPGSLIRGNDPSRCWRVESVEENRVTLRFGSEVRTLLMVHGSPTSLPAGRLVRADGTGP